jgi:hypothetical protein
MASILRSRAKGCSVVDSSVNRTGVWEVLKSAGWENPARLTRAPIRPSVEDPINDLLSFKILVRIAARVPYLLKGG